MRLSSVSYSEQVGTPQEWILEKFSLGPRNLVVGRNTSGKSRTLSIINALSKHLLGSIPPPFSGSSDFELIHDGKTYAYRLEFHEKEVVREELSIDGALMLTRGAGGEGTIFSEVEGELVRFQAPTSQVAASTRRDNIQHSFLEPLYEWASSLRHHQFGTTMGKDSLAVIMPDAPGADDRDQAQILGVFRHGMKLHGDVFRSRLIEDMTHVGFNITDVDLATPVSVRVEGLMNAVALFVKESDLPGITDHIGMSQGMFRVLSLLIQTNYYLLKNRECCVLVDDIGEGLDFERSCKLIALLREKTVNSGLQVIFSTNDQFVMNQVPLEEWSFFQRKGSRVRVRNMGNSGAEFEEFKFTGLSNFSFFELGLSEYDLPEAG